LWGDDDAASQRTNLSGSRFSTRDYAVDQSVNLMAMGDSSTNLSGSMSASQGSSFSVAGLFRGGRAPETGSRFDEYGDAAPSTESEEYISDKNRRMSPIFASCMYFFHSCIDSCAAFCGRRTLFPLLMAFFGVFILAAGIYWGGIAQEEGSKEKVVRTAIIDSGITAPEVFSASGSNPQKKAVKWMANTDPANLHAGDKGFLDRYALAVFYFGGNGKSGAWADNTNWMTEAGICSWHGIECKPLVQTAADGVQTTTRSYDANDSIMKIVLEGNRMTGVIPEEFGGLSDLIILDLTENSISGNLPVSVSKMSNLRDLLLRKNTIFGTFPAELTELTDLHQLNLGENQFDGPIPSSIGQMTALRSMSLGTNLFTGTFPDLEPMNKLVNLFLDDNDLGGTIPEYISAKTDLKILRLSKNKFKGTIPESFKALKNLEVLHLDENELTGTIPNMFDGAPRLYNVQLQQNRLNGTIPNKLWHLGDMKHLALDNNELTGTISGNIGTLGDIQTVSLHHNFFEGTVPSNIGFLTDLSWLTLNNNFFNGTIPLGIGGCYRLKTFHVDNNNLTGDIPTEMGHLNRLESVQLESNKLVGVEVPKEICNLVTEESLSHLSADCEEKITCSCCHECV